jgi:hypothetical protein
MISSTRKVSTINLPRGPTMKSHMTQSRLEVLVGEAIMLRTKHQYSIEKPQEKYSTP